MCVCGRRLDGCAVVGLQHHPQPRRRLDGRVQQHAQRPPRRQCHALRHLGGCGGRIPIVVGLPQHHGPVRRVHVERGRPDHAHAGQHRAQALQGHRQHQRPQAARHVVQGIRHRVPRPHPERHAQAHAPPRQGARPPAEGDRLPEVRRPVQVARLCHGQPDAARRRLHQDLRERRPLRHDPHRAQRGRAGGHGAHHVRPAHGVHLGGARGGRDLVLRDAEGAQGQARVLLHRPHHRRGEGHGVRGRQPLRRTIRR